MEKVQFILRYTGRVTLNHEYTVTIPDGKALKIDWFPDNDLIVEFGTRREIYNVKNCPVLGNRQYLIQPVVKENLYELPLRLARGDYLVAGDIVIDQRKHEYFKADQIDLLPDELVASHGNKVTRVLFSGNKSATENYIRKTQE